MSVDSCAQRWAEFEKCVLPDAPLELRQTLCVAFYSGFGSCLNAVTEIVEQNPSDEEGNRMLRELVDESMAFRASVESVGQTSQ